MKYSLENGKIINIPEKEIENSMKLLELSKEEAIQLWLEDNDYETNEELEELDAKAKKIKIDHGASANDHKFVKREKVVRKIEASQEKQTLFNDIKGFLSENYGNIEILKENKLFSLEINGVVFKIDLIQQRPSKK